MQQVERDSDNDFDDDNDVNDNERHECDLEEEAGEFCAKRERQNKMGEKNMKTLPT